MPIGVIVAFVVVFGLIMVAVSVGMNFSTPAANARSPTCCKRRPASR